MINPMEAVLVSAGADAGIAAAVGTRLGIRHRFGAGSGDWTVGATALTMRMDGGPADVFVPVQDFRIEVRCWGSTHADAWPVVGAVFEWARDLRRSRVAVSGGLFAMLYHVTPETAPAMMIDADTENPFYIFFMTASVHEVDVP